MSKILCCGLALALGGCFPADKFSEGKISAQHYKVPTGYDADVSLHPYTSGIGPCAEGASPSTGCKRPSILIAPSNYDRPPFNR
jgi:hypothetical protein